MAKTLKELSSKKILPYISRASKNAGHLDYMAGQMDAAGARKLAKDHTEKANRRRRGIETASKALVKEATDVLDEMKLKDRIEPHFGKKYEKPEHDTHTSSSDSGGARHKFVINKDHSVDYHSPEGRKAQYIKSPRYSSSAHQMVIAGIRHIQKSDPHANIHVHDTSGEYKKTVKKMNKDSPRFPRHTMSEETSVKQYAPSDFHKVFLSHGYRGASTTGKYSHPDVKRGASVKRGPNTIEGKPTCYVDHSRSNKKITSPRELDLHLRAVHNQTGNTKMNEENKTTPKKLKDIVNKPSRKWNELDGNTDDEKEIVARFRSQAVAHPDRNGNGDDVFKGSKQKHNGKPTLPGNDEKTYADSNGEVANVEETEVDGEVIYEAAKPMTRYGSEPITGRHLDFHWATKHVAPHGSRVSVGSNGRDAVVHHPDGSQHHIENGAVHQSEVKYDSKPSGKTDQHAGKFTVVKKTAPYGNVKDTGVSFVSSRKAHGTITGHHTTKDESQAHEFKSHEHAQNFLHVAQRAKEVFGDGGHPHHMEIHGKRDSNQIKRSKAAHAVAKRDHTSTLAKHGGDIFHPEVQKSYRKMQSTLHPAHH